jgi:hypothetical protein
VLAVDVERLEDREGQALTLQVLLDCHVACGVGVSSMHQRQQQRWCGES